MLKDRKYKVTGETSIWCNPNTGRPYALNTIREKFREVLVAENLENHRLYDTRATYITDRLLNSGNKLSTYLIAKAVGNSESQIRKSYENLQMRMAGSVLIHRETNTESQFSPIL